MTSSPRPAHRTRTLLCLGLLAAFIRPAWTAAPQPREPGLLFYLSADKGTTADFSAGGTPAPNFDYEVKVIPDGAKGPALQCGDLQRLAWWAPGNIYAQRGTLVIFLALPVSRRPDRVPRLPRRLRRPLELGHGLAAH